jgi:hypothetical protein
MSRIVDDVMHVLRQNGVERPMRASVAELETAIEANWKAIHAELALREREVGWIAQALAALVEAEQNLVSENNRLQAAWREKRDIVASLRQIVDKHTQHS